ncbi:type II secretion system pilot lipoprotein GspS [Candidatus Symbiopectobacterium sp. NZEC151]|uniref:type II secretion system pilot lipoprotein GspS n=1 Tax=Candidatus Symbiopectobacterium sp. NZEC151 TaxID=2820470 RepID=UPI0022270E37|nr:type II secretion system pilot lipoprotein GspS [Candidatus Symbiopectobacterium sp. NZEC151]MCW2475816.1 type II secretion system pilot lipoprotein GspS [Candidatus Symbiopectobacterium sp. NZEC151]
MRSPLLTFSAVTLLCITLVGCQAPTRSSTPVSSVSSVSTAEQLNQIASLVAASRYLKSQCNRSDIPDDGTLQRAALAVAQQKGWSTAHFTQLAARSENLYQGLLQDGTPKEAQCSEFNRSLAPFLDFIRKDFR